MAYYNSNPFTHQISKPVTKLEFQSLNFFARMMSMETLMKEIHPVILEQKASNIRNTHYYSYFLALPSNQGSDANNKMEHIL